MLDKCEVCHGKRGGVRGNENIIDGIIMCDYCTVEYWKEQENAGQQTGGQKE